MLQQRPTQTIISCLFLCSLVQSEVWQSHESQSHSWGEVNQWGQSYQADSNQKSWSQTVSQYLKHQTLPHQYVPYNALNDKKITLIGHGKEIFDIINILKATSGRKDIKATFLLMNNDKCTAIECFDTDSYKLKSLLQYYHVYVHFNEDYYDEFNNTVPVCYDDIVMIPSLEESKYFVDVPHRYSNNDEAKLFYNNLHNHYEIHLPPDKHMIVPPIHIKLETPAYKNEQTYQKISTISKDDVLNNLLPGKNVLYKSNNLFGAEDISKQNIVDYYNKNQVGSNNRNIYNTTTLRKPIYYHSNGIVIPTLPHNDIYNQNIKNGIANIQNTIYSMPNSCYYKNLLIADSGNNIKLNDENAKTNYNDNKPPEMYGHKSDFSNLNTKSIYSKRTKWSDYNNILKNWYNIYGKSLNKINNLNIFLPCLKSNVKNKIIEPPILKTSQNVNKNYKSTISNNDNTVNLLKTPTYINNADYTQKSYAKGYPLYNHYNTDNQKLTEHREWHASPISQNNYINAFSNQNAGTSNYFQTTIHDKELEPTEIRNKDMQQQSITAPIVKIKYINSPKTDNIQSQSELKENVYKYLMTEETTKPAPFSTQTVLQNEQYVFPTRVTSNKIWVPNTQIYNNTSTRFHSPKNLLNTNLDQAQTHNSFESFIHSYPCTPRYIVEPLSSYPRNKKYKISIPIQNPNKETKPSLMSNKPYIFPSCFASSILNNKGFYSEPTTDNSFSKIFSDKTSSKTCPNIYVHNYQGPLLYQYPYQSHYYPTYKAPESISKPNGQTKPLYSYYPLTNYNLKSSNVNGPHHGKSYQNHITGHLKFVSKGVPSFVQTISQNVFKTSNTSPYLNTIFKNPQQSNKLNNANLNVGSTVKMLNSTLHSPWIDTPTLYQQTEIVKNKPASTDYNIKETIPKTTHILKSYYEKFKDFGKPGILYGTMNKGTMHYTQGNHVIHSDYYNNVNPGISTYKSAAAVIPEELSYSNPYRAGLNPFGTTPKKHDTYAYLPNNKNDGIKYNHYKANNWNWKVNTIKDTTEIVINNKIPNTALLENNVMALKPYSVAEREPVNKPLNKYNLFNKTIPYMLPYNDERISRNKKVWDWWRPTGIQTMKANDKNNISASLPGLNNNVLNTYNSKFGTSYSTVPLDRTESKRFKSTNIKPTLNVLSTTSEPSTSCTVPVEISKNAIRRKLYSPQANNALIPNNNAYFTPKVLNLNKGIVALTKYPTFNAPFNYEPYKISYYGPEKIRSPNYNNNDEVKGFSTPKKTDIQPTYQTSDNIEVLSQNLAEPYLNKKYIRKYHPQNEYENTEQEAYAMHWKKEASKYKLSTPTIQSNYKSKTHIRKNTVPDKSNYYENISPTYFKYTKPHVFQINYGLTPTHSLNSAKTSGLTGKHTTGSYNKYYNKLPYNSHGTNTKSNSEKYNGNLAHSQTKQYYFNNAVNQPPFKYSSKPFEQYVSKFKASNKPYYYPYNGDTVPNLNDIEINKPKTYDINSYLSPSKIPNYNLASSYPYNKNKGAESQKTFLSPFESISPNMLLSQTIIDKQSDIVPKNRKENVGNTVLSPSFTLYEPNNKPLQQYINTVAIESSYKRNDESYRPKANNNLIGTKTSSFTITTTPEQMSLFKKRKVPFDFNNYHQVMPKITLSPNIESKYTTAYGFDANNEAEIKGMITNHNNYGNQGIRSNYPSLERTYRNRQPLTLPKYVSSVKASPALLRNYQMKVFYKNNKPIDSSRVNINSFPTAKLFYKTIDNNIASESLLNYDTTKQTKLMPKTSTAYYQRYHPYSESYNTPNKITKTPQLKLATNPGHVKYLQPSIYSPNTDTEVTLKSQNNHLSPPLTANEINNPLHITNVQHVVTEELKRRILTDKLINKLQKLYSPVTIDLGAIGLAKYIPDSCEKQFILKTDDPNIELRAWHSKLKVIKPKIVFDVGDVGVINFVPIIKCNYNADYERIQNMVIDIISYKYGEPIIVKDFINCDPYAVICDIKTMDIANNNFNVLWPTYDGNYCRNAHSNVVIG